MVLSSSCIIIKVFMIFPNLHSNVVRYGNYNSNRSAWSGEDHSSDGYCSQTKDLLASVTENGPRVGKYFVNLSGCQFAASRLINALTNSDIVICDEIGPMELKSMEFIEAARNLLMSDKNVIVVVHQKLEHPLVNQFREKSSSLISINLGNRKEVSKILLDKLNV
jgi:nucleoside-triphosphatase THEP1